MLKKANFWITIVYAAIILFNKAGLDDMNLLIFFSTPPLWILEQFSLGFPMEFFYVIGLSFWYTIGLFIDKKLTKH